MSNSLSLLKQVISHGEAVIIKSFLESHDIPVHLMDNDDVLNYVGFSGIRIMVLESDLQKAITLLETADLTMDE